MNLRWHFANIILRIHVAAASEHKQQGLHCAKCARLWPCPARQETDSRVARFPKTPTRWPG